MAKESAVSEESGRAASQKQLILIGVMFALLLGVVYFMFLRGGGEEPAVSAAPAPAPSTQASPDDEEPEDKAEAPKKKGKGPVETSEVFGGKDPFEPVLDLTAASGTASEATATTTDAGTTTTTDDTTTDDTTTAPVAPTVPTTPTPPTPPPDDDDDVVKTGYGVKLIKVQNEDGNLKALLRTVRRDKEIRVLHEVVSGDRFRKVFKLTSLDKQCGTFLHGSDWFALCEGQRTVFE